jgi:hypothetical protein
MNKALTLIVIALVSLTAITACNTSQEPIEEPNTEAPGAEEPGTEPVENPAIEDQFIENETETDIGEII